MPVILQSCKCVGGPILQPLPKTVRNRAFSATPEGAPRKFLNLGPPFVVASIVSQSFHPIWGAIHVASCLKGDELEGVSNTELPQKTEEGNVIQELELLDRPSPVNVNSGSASEVDFEPRKISKDDALEPFLKFFKGNRDVEEQKEDDGETEVSETKNDLDDDSVRHKKVSVQYYEPKPGDFVVGVVVSGNENKLDINVGADMLGTMLTKEVLPFYVKEMDYLLCDLKRDAEDFMTPGNIGILGYDEAISEKSLVGRPVVDVGTILFAEVLGRTLSGRPLLSSRRFFRRIAWHRVRQIKQLNEPIKVRITEWNTGGLLTRIEGLRAFLPKTELLTRVNSFTELKENVGHDLHVLVTRMEEAKNDLVLSQRQAWEKVYLREGTLIDGTVRKIYPFGAQVRLGESNISGLLHVSNISRKEVTSVEKVVDIDEKIKVIVVKSPFPNKISLSIADLESEPGLFLSNKEKVFSEAGMMAKKYREKLPPYSESEPLPVTASPFENEAITYANWTWFKFEKHIDQTYESINGDNWELVSPISPKTKTVRV